MWFNIFNPFSWFNMFNPPAQPDVLAEEEEDLPEDFDLEIEEDFEEADE